MFSSSNIQIIVYDIKLYLLGEPLGKYHKIETLKRLNIYISAYQAIIRSSMKFNFVILT